MANSKDIELITKGVCEKWIVDSYKYPPFLLSLIPVSPKIKVKWYVRLWRRIYRPFIKIRNIIELIKKY